MSDEPLSPTPPSRKSRFRPPEGLQRLPDTSFSSPDPADEDFAVEGAKGESTPVENHGAAGSEAVASEYDSPDLRTSSGQTLELPSTDALGSEGHHEDDLPAGFRLRTTYDGPPPMSRRLLTIYMTMVGLVALAIGVALGAAFLGSRDAAPQATAKPAYVPLPGKPNLPEPLSPQLQAQIDAAFAADKQRQYKDAQQRFSALHDAHPEWPSMGIESARSTLYLLDAAGTMKILSALTRNGALPDSEFLAALVHLTHQEFDPADHDFAEAVALDPARADIYYFWGECLRAQGKPHEAIGKFRAALLRNQYETAQDLYQLKLWLSEIQADQEAVPGGANSEIDPALALQPRPPYSAVFADAARQIKAGHFKEAGTLLARAQELTEPIIFRVILQDPTFAQENWRAEFKEFYK